MALHLITGHLDENHITAENQGALNTEIFGVSNFAFEHGRDFESSKISNNLVRIYDGMGMFEGRQFELETGDYEDITVENGEQNLARRDLIVARYVKDNETAVETISFEIIKGTASVTPVRPAYNDGSIIAGDSTVDFPLYEVYIDGLEIQEITALFEVRDGIDETLSEITDAKIDEWWGETLQDGDEMEF